MRRILATIGLAGALALGMSGCSAQTVQLWWNLNGGSANPLSTDVAQVIADNINQQCHPSYWPCLGYSSDYDCARTDRATGLRTPGLCS